MFNEESTMSFQCAIFLFPTEFADKRRYFTAVRQAH